MGHPWKFLATVDRQTFASGKPATAVRTLRQAVSELRRTAKTQPLIAAEGVFELLVRLGPALAPVDESSGSLEHAVARTLDATVELARGAASCPQYDGWLDQLAHAVVYEGADTTGCVHQAISLRWGSLCGTRAAAERWIERLLPDVVRQWSTPEGYAVGGLACLSCLSACGHHTRVLELLKCRPVPIWVERQFGVHALVELDRIDEALTYAQYSNPLGHHYDSEIARTCEALLLANGQRERAYRSFAIAAGQRQNCLQTYRTLAAKYPEVPESTLLSDLVASTPGEEGRWFATARHLRFFQLALELAKQTPCDPKTLHRAAADHLAQDPAYAGELARAALKWLIAGFGVEISAEDVYASYDLAKKALARSDRGVAGVVLLNRELKGLCDAPTQAASWVRSLLHYELYEDQA